MVEAPGTAPGSTTLISRTVYHHSQQADRPDIGARQGEWKRVILGARDRQAGQPCNLGRSGGASGDRTQPGRLDLTRGDCQPSCARRVWPAGHRSAAGVVPAEIVAKDARMALVQSLEMEPHGATTWTVALQHRRLSGQLTFEFFNGLLRSARHRPLDGAERAYDYPFSGRSPVTEANVRLLVTQHGADFAISELERNQYVRFRTDIRVRPVGRHGTRRALSDSGFRLRDRAFIGRTAGLFPQCPLCRCGYRRQRP